jgi:hypothetical protein
VTGFVQIVARPLQRDGECSSLDCCISAWQAAVFTDILRSWASSPESSDQQSDRVVVSRHALHTPPRPLSVAMCSDDDDDDDDCAFASQVFQRMPTRVAKAVLPASPVGSYSLLSSDDAYSDHNMSPEPRTQVPQPTPLLFASLTPASTASSQFLSQVAAHDSPELAAQLLRCKNFTAAYFAA